MEIVADKLFFSPDFLLKFIEKYRNLPCLWKVKSEGYPNNALRQEALDELATFSKKINPNADISWIKKKISSMKGKFWKAFKKAKRKEASTQVYKPKLWYYEHLLFLKNQEISMLPIGNIDDGVEEVKDSSSIPLEESEIIQAASTRGSQPTAKEKKKTEAKKAKKRKRTQDQQSSDDEYDFHGKTIAAKLRRIAKADYEQFLLADTLINEVLFKAVKQRLTEYSSIGDKGGTERTSCSQNPASYYDMRYGQPQPHRKWQSQNPDNSNDGSSSSSAATEPATTTTVTGKDFQIKCEKSIQRKNCRYFNSPF